MIGLPNWLNKFRKIVTGGGGGGGYSLVAHQKANAAGTSTATTAAVDTTGAKLIIIIASWYDTSATVTDSKGNTYTALTDYKDSSTVEHCRIFYCINPTVGSGHTFSLTADYSVICAAAFSYSGGTPAFDVETGYNHSGATVSSFNPGSVTGTGSAPLYVVGATWNTVGVTVTSLDSPFSTALDQSGQGGNTLNGMLSYANTTGAQNPTINFSGSVSAGAAAIAAFK